jgi:hypothetical protein
MIVEEKIAALIEWVTQLEVKICQLETKVNELTSVQEDVFKDLENLEMD